MILKPKALLALDWKVEKRLLLIVYYALQCQCDGAIELKSA